jgi:hypothetical protein
MSHPCSKGIRRRRRRRRSIRRKRKVRKIVIESIGSKMSNNITRRGIRRALVEGLLGSRWAIFGEVGLVDC